MEQIGRTAWIDENPVHIKTVNTYSQYECVVVWCDDLCRVNRGKGYRAVNQQNCCDIPLVANGVYSGSDRGLPEHSSLPFLGLILAVSRSPSIKLMVARGPEACSISATALSTAGATVAPWVGSLRYRLRCSVRISFFIRNLRL